MKKALTILEIILLFTVLLTMTWGRFDGNLSSPFFLEPTTFRIFLSVGISLAVVYRLLQLVKLVWTGKPVKFKLQALALGLYIITAATDIISFAEWNIHARMYFYVTTILLTPFILGVAGVLTNELKKN